MIYKHLKKFAAEKGWYRTSNAVFGVHQNYFFNIAQGSVMSNPQFKNFHCPTQKISSSQKTGLEEAFKMYKEELKYTEVTILEDEIQVYFIETWRYIKGDRLNEILNTIESILKAQNIKNRFNITENVGYYKENNLGVAYTPSEFEARSKALAAIAVADAEEHNSYLRGFMGALLYSLPVILVWVLLAAYLGVMSSALGTIIAALGIKGYISFKGKKGFGLKWILFASSLLVCLLANVASVFVEIYNVAHEFISLPRIYALMLENQELYRLVTGNLFLSLFLAFVGWIGVVLGMQVNNFEIQPAEKVVL